MSAKKFEMTSLDNSLFVDDGSARNDPKLDKKRILNRRGSVDTTISRLGKHKVLAPPKPLIGVSGSTM